MLTAVVSILQWLLVSPASGWVGALMHFFSTGGFVLTTGLIYHHDHTKRGAAISLAAGTLIMTLLMVPLNLYFTVHYNGAPAEFVRSIIWPVIIPFNLIKGIINSAATFLICKRTAKVLRAEWHK